MNFAHTSVLIQESMGLLKPRPGERYLDGTLGGGGHAEEILLRSSPDGRVLGLDWDEDAVTAAGQRLSRFGERLTIRRANFDQAKDILGGYKLESSGWCALGFRCLIASVRCRGKRL